MRMRPIIFSDKRICSVSRLPLDAMRGSLST